LSASRTHRSRPAPSRPPQWWAVVGVVTLLVAASLALLPAVPDRPGLGLLHSVTLVVVLTAMFALAEVFVLHVQVKREAQTIALSEIPLVLGLTFAPPPLLVLGFVLGAAGAYLLHRRQRGLKLAYNVSLKATDSLLTVVLYGLILGGNPILGWRWVLGCYVAVAAASLLDGLVTHLVIGLHEGSLSRSTLQDVAVYPAMALAVATISLVMAYAFDRSAMAALPATLSGAALFLGYRAYSTLSERHLSLERLYRFSQAVASTPEIDGTLGHVLGQAKELLRSEHAEIAFFSGLEGSAMRVALSPSGRLLRESVRLTDDDPFDPARTGEGDPMLMSRNSHDPQQRSYLSTRRWKEAIVVPLKGDAGIIGTLSVADRMGDVRRFDQSDMRLLETVANHAGVALQNSRLIDQLRHESLHDALTGLPNRVLLRNNISEELEACRIGASPGCAVMIMDLDGFKDVNDTLGHQHGDELLKVVASRTVVAAGESVTVARLGGDEFALMAPGCADASVARVIAAAVLAALRAPTILDGIPVHVGASIGVAMAPGHATAVADLLRYADVAMYAAKAAGGGVKIYESDRDTSSPDKLTLVTELRTALEQGDLAIHVQPKADLSSGEVGSVEILARWDHPRRGLVSPEEFIPLAERTGLMDQLTEHVLRLALFQCAGWRDAGVEVNIAVNLSARSLAQPGLAATVGALLLGAGVPAHLLTLEITESTVMADPEVALRSLKNLRDLGVRLSIDDFGVGYSSLSNLSRMPVQELKIDRSFVTDLSDNLDNAVIVRSIIDLGRNLALDVVAEGVERLQEWEQLRQMGCHQAQGYFVARPMPPELLPGWLRKWADRSDTLRGAERDPAEWLTA